MKDRLSAAVLACLLLVAPGECSGCRRGEGDRPSAAEDAEPAADAPGVFHFLIWDHAGAERVEISVNGIPVDWTTEFETGLQEVGRFLRPGKNGVRFVASYAVDELPFDVLAMKLTLVSAGSAKAVDWQAKDIWSRGKPLVAGPLEKGKADYDVVRSFEVADVARQTWHDAEELDQLTAADRAALLAHVDRMYEIFVDKDAEAYVALAEEALAWAAMAEGRASDEVREGLSRCVRSIMSGEGYTVERAKPGQIETRPLGRLTLVTAPEFLVRAGTAEKSAGGSPQARSLEARHMVFYRTKGTWRFFAGM